jgi:hypothetical protein
MGGIHVDDLSFDEQTCEVQPDKVKGELASATASFLTTRAPEIPASAEVNCNFDLNNTCGWVNDQRADLKWTLSKGRSTNLATGPSTDVSGSGYYAFLDTSQSVEGSKARLVSPKINRASLKSPSI